MTKQREPGDAYWAGIEEAFETVDVHGGPKKLLARFGRLEPRTANLLAAHRCQSEICNGGLLQFFRNTTGVLAPEALRAFRAMGLVEWEHALQKAMGFFGSDYPRELPRRRKALAALAKGWIEQEREPFFDLDEQFFDWLAPDQDRWNKPADAYLAGSAA